MSSDRISSQCPSEQKPEIRNWRVNTRAHCARFSWHRVRPIWRELTSSVNARHMVASVSWRWRWSIMTRFASFVPETHWPVRPQ